MSTSAFWETTNHIYSKPFAGANIYEVRAYACIHTDKCLMIVLDRCLL